MPASAFRFLIALAAAAALAAASPRHANGESVVVFNEIMYHPAGPEEGRMWVELHNQNAVDIDMSGWRIDNGIRFEFPAGTVIRARGYLVVSDDRAVLEAETGFADALGPFSGRLSNSGETLDLYDRAGRLVNSVTYADEDPWPDGPDGSGFTLAKRDPLSAPDDPRNWTVSAQPGGTPGAQNFPLPGGAPTSARVVDFESLWRYDASGAVPDPGWAGIGFDDSAWPQGRGILSGGASIDPQSPRPSGVRLEGQARILNAGFESGFEGQADEWLLFDGAFAAETGDPGTGAAPVPEGRRMALLPPGARMVQPAGAFASGQPYVLTGLWNASGGGALPVVEALAAPVFDPGASAPTQRHRRFQSAPFTPSTGSALLRLRNNAAESSPAATFDSLVAHRAVPVVAQGNFEEPVLPGSPGFQYNPPGTVWAGNGFAYSRSNLGFGGAPREGDQAVALQGGATIAQTISGFEVGRQYVLAWSEADRPGTLGGNDYRVVLGGQVIHPLRLITDPTWREVRTAPFTASSATMELRFEAFNTAGGDRSVLLDEIRFEPVFGPPATGDAIASGPVSHRFRRVVEIPADPGANRLSLRVEGIFDDGAVLYWNGVEAFRWNMPDGPVDSMTRAVQEVGNAAFHPPIVLTGLEFHEGANILAASVHQGPGGDPDVLFGLRVEAVLSPSGFEDSPHPLAFSELSPAGEQHFVEIRNDGDAPINLAEYRIEHHQGGVYFPAGALPPGARVAYTGQQMGFPANPGHRVYLFTADRDRMLDWARFRSRTIARPEGQRAWRYPTAPTPGQPNIVEANDSIVINEIMYHAAPQDAAPAQESVEQLIAIDAPWRYFQDGPPPPAWWLRLYDDSAWPVGPALLYVENSPLPAPKNTPLVLGQRAYYFRHTFDFDGDIAALDALRIRPIIDDGAVFFLNGVEVLRFNMPDGPVDHSTFAASTIGNAAFTGPYDIPTAHLRQGSNTLAVRVHQASVNSSDIVFGMELFAVEGIPGIPFGDNPEEWLELANIADEAVDISGWAFVDGIRYEFPSGTVMAPGEHLVLAKLPLQLAEAHPGIRIMGPFDGRLSRSGERLLLVDARGNPAQEITYADRRPWPAAADGEGHSIELIDPRADSANPANWAASDESPRSEWVTVVRRGFAVEPPNSNNPSVFNEFLLGLVTDGVVLIDDVSVVEDPDGAAIQRIQNGGFSNGMAHWRARGNHGRTTVVPDPDNPGNNVLRVVSEGQTEHMGNLVETTFAGNAPIRTNVPYEISFRARWIEGSNRLNTRLYFNRLSETTVLPRPPHNGTPGRPNSRLVDNAGPDFGRMRVEPVYPAAGEPVVVSVPVQDRDGVASVDLRWRRDGEAWQSTPMPLVDGEHRAVLPGEQAGTLVQMYAEAVDGLGAVARHPRSGADSAFLVQWDDGRRGAANRQTLRLLMTSDAVAQLHGTTNVMSNARVPGTLVVEDRIAHYDVGVRLKGSGYGRQGNRTGFNIQFDSGDLYRGVQTTIAIDRNGGPTAVGASQVELVAKHVAYRAGGIGHMIDDVATILAPRDMNTGSAQVLLSRYNDLFLETTPGFTDDGPMWEFELVYFPTDTIDGNPESPKRNPNSVLGIDFVHMGPAPDAYRWNYEVKNRSKLDDFSAVIAFTESLSLTGSALDAATRQTMDMDNWMRYGAYMSLTGIADTYWTGTLPHNLRLYADPATGRMRILPWDSDHAFHPAAYNSTLEPPPSYLLSKVTNLPRNRRLLHGHAHHLMQQVFTIEYLEPWIRHYGEVSDSEFDADILDYIAHRRAFAQASFPPVVPFAVTSNSGNPITTGGLSVPLSGTAWIDLKEFRIAGRPGVLDLEWPTMTSWTVVVPIGPGLNDLVFEAYDFDGNLAATAAIQVTSTSPAPPLAESLKLTEMMYDPIGGNEYEFIEFQNQGLSTIDIGGLQAVRGINFTLDANIPLAPGAFALVVGSEARFEERYGPGLPVVGSFTGNLSNSGENIEIVSVLGDPIAVFRYEDTRGWPLAADGPGHSLVPLPRSYGGQATGLLSFGGNWRASAFIGGSPGAADPEPPPGPILVEFAAHTDYTDPLDPLRDSNDWIEILNPTSSPIVMDDWYLSDRKGTLQRWAFPNGFTIPAEGRVVLDEVTGFNNPLGSGFALSKDGEVILLSHLPGNGLDRVVDEVRFEGQENGPTLSRTPEDPLFWNQTIATRGLPNASKTPDVVIEEFHYFPSPEQEAAGGTEFLRLRNPTSATIAFANSYGPWRLSDGIGFVFPAGSAIGPGESLLVVPFDPSNGAALAGFASAYGLAGAPQRILGPYSGALSNTGERISLERPMGESFVIVDELIYFHATPYPSSAAGQGDSLHRLDHLVSGVNPANWAASPPEPGSGVLADPEPTWWLIR